MKPIVFAPIARDELEAAAGWYESRAVGLGEQFVQCIGEIVRRIGVEVVAVAHGAREPGYWLQRKQRVAQP